MPGFIEEFKRRNVFRVAMAYLVITWLVLQVADTAAPLLRLPEWVSSFVFLCACPAIHSDTDICLGV